MFGREFQVVDVEQRKARPEKSVLWNGQQWNCRGVESAATDARCDETVEVGRRRRVPDLERQNG